jgi:fructosamine-3-kinase
MNYSDFGEIIEDGYSETTYIYNLDKILEIYKSFGGKEIMRDLSNVFSS